MLLKKLLETEIECEKLKSKNLEIIREENADESNAD